MQQVLLRAQTPLPLAPQVWPGLEHSWGLYASRAHRAAICPPTLHPLIGEQQILGPKHRPDRAGPHRVHWTKHEVRYKYKMKSKTNLSVDSSWRQEWSRHHRAFPRRWTVGDEAGIRMTGKKEHDNCHRQNKVQMSLSHFRWCDFLEILK